jgi:TolB-like protein
VKRLAEIAILVAALVTCAGVHAAPAAAPGDRPLLAVLPFNGPAAKQAEVMVVRTLRKKATIVPQATWKKAAKKLFAPSHSAEDIADVAADVGAQVVVTGIVKRDGRRWELSVSVRDGKTGKVRDRLKYPLKGPRLSADVVALLTKEVNDAFDALIASPGEDIAPVKAEKPEKPVATAKPPTTPGKPAPTTPAQEEAQTEPTPAAPAANPPATTTTSPTPTPTPTAPGEPAAPVVHAEVAKPAPARRPHWAPYFDLSVGPTISGRSFDFDPASQPKFSSGVVAGVRADFTLTPLAGTWKRAGGAFAGLGIGATIDKPFWPDSTSKQDPTMKFGTSELRVEGGLRWRIVLAKAIPRPQLLIQAGGGWHSFAIGKDAMGLDVGPADVSYKYATFGAGMRIHFAEWAWIWAMFDYHVVFDPGPIADATTEYGAAKTFGIRVRGGLDFLVYKGFKIGLEGLYERFSLTFNPSAACATCKVANSGTDQYFGGVIVVGYVL